MSDKSIKAKHRQAVESRAQECCEYCRSQARFGPQSFSIEHIQRLSRDVKTELDNLALA
ncbi:MULTISPECIES: HNH endonuclease signature motif containing protein [Moorena]|uniref:HNH domain-containing protein n=1 Tax=Moorena producens 3L TaxID=489825 RepID=F4XY25_9CYAN|nr:MULTISPECIES: HNH endonuclease signature motif containing protein [Moorena]NEQ12682.1 HNH endonuclease [Moorena sp. SIO3E2]EGJ30531.1 hypothetical protein LYNGBM3L_50730 [Moorena producens 3L]NEP31227.1 HNH endonuclease [Moorena sp. SIO3B2]NEP66945.1 HNH endonuclease [Moorena sp. SIO3A5]NEQ09821.1 HNH endonuclease [Moorena sp. SIO4E2]